MSFKLARLKGRSVPRVRELPVAAGAAFERGALLVVDANGNYAEAAANPAAVAAVAETAFGPNTSGFGNITGTREFPPGKMLGTTVADEVSFRARYLGALPAANGGTFGATRDADGLWKVDFAKPAGTAGVTALVKLLNRFTNAPENQAEIEVVFLPGVVQLI